MTVSKASWLFIPQQQLSSLSYLINYWVEPDSIEQASLYEFTFLRKWLSKEAELTN